MWYHELTEKKSNPVLKFRRSRFSRCGTCYCDLSLDLADGVLGQTNDAVTETRLMTLNLRTAGVALHLNRFFRTFGARR